MRVRTNFYDMLDICLYSSNFKFQREFCASAHIFLWLHTYVSMSCFQDMCIYDYNYGFLWYLDLNFKFFKKYSKWISYDVKKRQKSSVENRLRTRYLSEKLSPENTISFACNPIPLSSGWPRGEGKPVHAACWGTSVQTQVGCAWGWLAGAFVSYRKRWSPNSRTIYIYI